MRELYFGEVEKRISHIKINGHRTNRLPGNANISFKGVNGATLLEELDKRGICASSGSACSAGFINPSHVLLAIGIPKNMARSSLRITFGRENTIDDVKYLVDTLVEIVDKLR